MFGGISQQVRRLPIGGYGIRTLEILTMSTTSIHRVLPTTTMPTTPTGFPPTEFYTLKSACFCKVVAKRNKDMQPSIVEYRGDAVQGKSPNMLDDAYALPMSNVSRVSSCPHLAAYACHSYVHF